MESNDKFFRFTARAVPHDSLIKDGGNAEEMPIFTQFSKEELNQLDVRGLGLCIDHTGGDVFGYAVDKFPSDKNSCLVMIEIPPENGINDPKIENDVRTTQEKFKHMIKNKFVPDVSLSHRPEFIYDEETNTMDIKKYLQEISITMEGGREGSSILEWHEADTPYNADIYKKRRDEINAEYVKQPNGGNANIEGIEYLEDGTRIVKNKGMCRSVVQISPTEISNFPKIIQANIKKFSPINKNVAAKILDTQEFKKKEKEEEEMSGTTQKSNQDDIGAIIKKYEESQKELERLRPKAVAYDTLAKETEKKEKEEALKHLKSAYEEATARALALQKTRDDVRKAAVAATTANGTPIADTLSTAVDDEIGAITELLKQLEPEGAKSINTSIEADEHQVLVFNQGKLSDIVRNGQYPLVAFSRLRDLEQTTRLEQAPMMAAMKNIATATENLKTLANNTTTTTTTAAAAPPPASANNNNNNAEVKKEQKRFLSFSGETAKILEAKRRKQTLDPEDVNLPK